MCLAERKFLYTPRNKYDATCISFAKTIAVAIQKKKRGKKKMFYPPLTSIAFVITKKLKRKSQPKFPSDSEAYTHKSIH